MPVRATRYVLAGLIAALLVSCSPARVGSPAGGWMPGRTDGDGYGLAVRRVPRDDLAPRLLGAGEPHPLMPIQQGSGQATGEMPPARTQSAWTAAEYVHERDGHLQRDESTGRWRFVFHPRDGDDRPVAAMEILPNEFLAEMERIAAGQAPARTVFHISAEVTLYRGRRYLLIRKATWERPSGK